MQATICSFSVFIYVLVFVSSRFHLGSCLLHLPLCSSLAGCVGHHSFVCALFCMFAVYCMFVSVCVCCALLCASLFRYLLVPFGPCLSLSYVLLCILGFLSASMFACQPIFSIIIWMVLCVLSLIHVFVVVCFSIYVPSFSASSCLHLFCMLLCFRGLPHICLCLFMFLVFLHLLLPLSWCLFLCLHLSICLLFALIYLLA